MGKRLFPHWAANAIRLLLVLALAACGAGEDPAVEAPPPTPLPNSLTLDAPLTRQALGAKVTLTSNAADPDHKLLYRWDFGDGSSAALASPAHAYAKAGTYVVSLTVTNEVGSSASATVSVTVADTAIVKGRVCTGPDLGGWCWQNPLPQGNPINDFFWLDGQRGWAVGGSGTVLKTADGGGTWTAQASGTRANLLKITFVDDRVGWVGGSNGLLLRTADGGTTWKSASVGVDINLREIGVADDTMAWVTANQSSYLTTDGGVTWKRIQPPNNWAGYGLVQTSVSTLWAYAFNQGAATVVRTTDSGANWLPQTLTPLAPGLNRSFGAMVFASAQHGLVQINDFGFDSLTQNFVSQSATLLTADSGASWHALTPRPGANFGSSGNYLLAADGTVFERDPVNGAIAYTTDAGANWRSMRLPSSNNFFLIGFFPYSSSRVRLQGGAGNGYLTSDGGMSWSDIRGGFTFSSAANSIWFFDAREGLVLTEDGNSLRTSDGGQTWVPRQAEVNCCFSWSRMEFLPGTSTGWAVPAGGQIYRSTDRGRTWLSPVPQTSARMGNVLDYHFIDASRGWALSENYSVDEGKLFSSADGGSSWQSVPASSNLLGMVALRFADANHGVAVGSAGIAMLTSDGGASWRPRPTGSDQIMRKVAFVDAQTVLAVGDLGTILRSTDRGQNWTRVVSPTAFGLRNVRFLSATVGHAVGDFGTVLHTRDGGLTWLDASAGTQLELRGVFFIDENTGWAVGSNGAILATISGGR